MTDKKPTEQLVAASYSVQGLSSSSEPEPNLPQTIAGSLSESKPITSTGQDNCVHSSGPTARTRPKQLKNKRFYQNVDAVTERVLRQCIALWGSRRARLRKTLLEILTKLLHRPHFLDGARVAYSQEHLCEHIRVHRSTIIRAIAALRELPQLVRVITVHPGEPAYNGLPARKKHLEFELGNAFGFEAHWTHEVAHQCVQTADISRGLNAAQPVTEVARCTATGSTALPDQCVTTDPKSPVQNLELKLFNKRNPPKRELLALQPPPTRRKNQLRLAPDTRRGINPKFLQSVAPWPVRLIQQHRRIAEQKGDAVPIAQNELELAQIAWEQLDGSPKQRLRQCAEVSAMALQDSQRNGRSAASLNFAFGMGHDDFNPLFERLARLREKKQRVRKHTNAAANAQLAWSLFGSPPTPSPAPSLPRRARHRPRRSISTASEPGQTKSPCSPQEIALILDSWSAANYQRTA